MRSPGRIGAAPRHRLHRGLELLARVAEHPVEEDVEGLDQRVMSAEGPAQCADCARELYLAMEPGEVPDVAAAEAVDRLLHVAHQETLRPI